MKDLTIEELIDQVALHATGGIDEMLAEGKVPVITIYLAELRRRLTPKPPGDITKLLNDWQSEIWSSGFAVEPAITQEWIDQVRAMLIPEPTGDVAVLLEKVDEAFCIIEYIAGMDLVAELRQAFAALQTSEVELLGLVRELVENDDVVEIVGEFGTQSVCFHCESEYFKDDRSCDRPACPAVRARAKLEETKDE